MYIYYIVVSMLLFETKQVIPLRDDQVSSLEECLNLQKKYFDELVTRLIDNSYEFQVTCSIVHNKDTKVEGEQ